MRMLMSHQRLITSHCNTVRQPSKVIHLKTGFLKTSDFDKTCSLTQLFLGNSCHLGILN